MRSLLVFAVVAAALASVVFCIAYGVRSPWYKSLVGRMQFTKSLCLCAALLLTVTNVFFHGYRGQLVVSSIVLVCLAIALWFQVVVLLRIQSGSLDHNRHYGKEDNVRTTSGT